MQTNPKKDEPVRGVVIEALPNTSFTVRLENENQDELLAHLSGKMRLHHIRVLVGDTVLVEPDQYSQRGRIVKRV